MIGFGSNEHRDND